ncbi:hypothetical protein H4Q26_013768 [Puccinia striiformis f. sp. tritici PST-130]|nr:hypothetical protein H4Q26_013768 [Puccinia striiformis f. sp. tritici PST-130]
MGNDGGSIPKRDDLVRTRAGKSRVDEQAKQVTKWADCSLSKQKLEDPIVCDRLGKLYNKSSILEFLIDQNHYGQDGNSLKEFGIGIGKCELRWLCLVDCGCILTEPGLKQVGGNNCPVCGKSVIELITVNPSAQEEEEVRFKVLEQRVKEQEEKERKKSEKRSVKRINNTYLILMIKSKTPPVPLLNLAKNSKLLILTKNLHKTSTRVQSLKSLPNTEGNPTEPRQSIIHYTLQYLRT